MKKINLSYEMCKKFAEQITNKEKSLAQISRETNIGETIIRKNIKNYGLKYEVSNKKIIFTTEQIKEALNDYNNGTPLKKVAKKYGTNEQTLSKIFKENNIDITKSDRYGKHVYFNLNNRIFENIDTEEKAYWLGFILADGYIDAKYQHLEVGLREDDKEHLEKLKIFLNADTKLRYKAKTKSYTLYVCSKDICRDLKKHGVENAKSLTCRLNTDIMNNPKLKNHYLRGFWDGDGSVYITKENRFQISFVKNKHIINDIRENVPQFKDMKPQNKKGTQGYQISIAHKKSLDFIKDIYKDSHVYLDRKFNKIIAVCDEKYPSISQIIRTE